MKVLKVVLLGLVVILVLLVGIGVLLPRDWDVERSILIEAPKSRIHTWVESPARWNDWFAWEEMKSDPTYKVWTSGAEKGAGAIYQWSGDSAGRGKLVITHSDANSGIHIDEWIEADDTGPKNATGRITYTDGPDDSTRVTWSDQGTLPPIIGGYVRGLVNGAIGTAFEKGLANLKAKVEAK